MNGVLQGSIFGLTLFLLYINDFPDDHMLKIATCADDATLYSNCEQVSTLESDLRDTVDWGRKWLIDL